MTWNNQIINFLIFKMLHVVVVYVNTMKTTCYEGSLKLKRRRIVLVNTTTMVFHLNKNKSSSNQLKNRFKEFSLINSGQYLARYRGFLKTHPTLYSWRHLVQLETPFKFLLTFFCLSYSINFFSQDKEISFDRNRFPGPWWCSWKPLSSSGNLKWYLHSLFDPWCKFL